MTNPRHLHEQASKMFDIDACGRCEVCSKLNVHTKLRRNPLLLRGMSNVDTCKGIFDIDSVYFRKKNERLSQPCANSIARRACHHAQELSEKLRRSEVEHRMFGKTVKAGVVAVSLGPINLLWYLLVVCHRFLILIILVLINPCRKYNMPFLLQPFTQSEIQLGRIIGLGGFSSVYEIEKIRLNQAISDSLSDQEKVAREFIAANLYHDSPTIFFETPRFVVKHVSTRLASSQESFQRAALNLVAEGVLLKTMDHPNIISLRGCTAGGPDSYRNLDPRAYFLILDYLEETLDARMDRWNQLLIKYRRRRSLPWFRRKYDIKIRNLHKERLQVLYEVACAIEYVHTQRIVHGDIKTMNIGFDESGRTKIFDFGLAQVLPHDDSQNGSCVFSLPCVGTVSYMAPEVRSKSRMVCLPMSIRSALYCGKFFR